MLTRQHASRSSVSLIDGTFYTSSCKATVVEHPFEGVQPTASVLLELGSVVCATIPPRPNPFNVEQTSSALWQFLQSSDGIVQAVDTIANRP